MKFQYTFQLAVGNLPLPDVTVTPHTLFCPPEGTATSVTEEVCHNTTSFGYSMEFLHT